MNWAIKYAVKNLEEGYTRLEYDLVPPHAIRFTADGVPDALAIISTVDEMDIDEARKWINFNPEADFLCGFKRQCTWHGDAIEFVHSSGMGWGNFGTLLSAASEGNANTAQHKEYSFGDKILRQHRAVESVNRLYDKLYELNLRSGNTVKVVIATEYEPSADEVRSLWDQFGPVSLIYNINPNRQPTGLGYSVATELGTKIVGHSEIGKLLFKM